MTVPRVLIASVAKPASERTADIYPSVLPRLSLLESGSHQWRRWQKLVPLSLPTGCRSAPIRTTACVIFCVAIHGDLMELGLVL